MFGHEKLTVVSSSIWDSLGCIHRYNSWSHSRLPPFNDSSIGTTKRVQNFQTNQKSWSMQLKIW